MVGSALVAKVSACCYVYLPYITGTAADSSTGDHMFLEELRLHSIFVLPDCIAFHTIYIDGDC